MTKVLIAVDHLEQSTSQGCMGSMRTKIAGKTLTEEETSTNAVAEQRVKPRRSTPALSRLAR